eukprot:s308_g1.t1
MKTTILANVKEGRDFISMVSVGMRSKTLCTLPAALPFFSAFTTIYCESEAFYSEIRFRLQTEPEELCSCPGPVL